jgi:hypothetical protein
MKMSQTTIDDFAADMSRSEIVRWRFIAAAAQGAYRAPADLPFVRGAGPAGSAHLPELR